MNSVIVDTNVLVYIYSGIPNTGRKYAELLGDLSTYFPELTIISTDS